MLACVTIARYVATRGSYLSKYCIVMFVTWQARQQKLSPLSQELYRATYLAVKAM